MTDYTNSAAPAVLPIDAKLADAISNIADLIQHGQGNVTPDDVACLIEAAQTVAPYRSPLTQVATVVFTQEGANYEVPDKRVWETPDAIVNPSSAARAVRLGNTVIQITTAGESLLAVFVDEAAAKRHLEALREQVMAPVEEPAEAPPVATGFVGGEGPVFEDATQVTQDVHPQVNPNVQPVEVDPQVEAARIDF